MENKMKNAEEVIKNLIDAWEFLEGNKRYESKIVERWLINNMKPAIDKARDFINTLDGKIK